MFCHLGTKKFFTIIYDQNRVRSAVKTPELPNLPSPQDWNEKNSRTPALYLGPFTVVVPNLALTLMGPNVFSQHNLLFPVAPLI